MHAQHYDNQITGLSAEWQAALIGAALLETFDAAAFNAILSQATKETGNAVPPLLSQLVMAELVQAIPAGYMLTSAAQAAIQDALDALPMAERRTLHQQATQHYAYCLVHPRYAGNNSTRSDLADNRDLIEQHYMHQMQQLCELLIQQDPTALADTAATTPFDSLAVPAHRHLLRYYHGLGLGLRDEFAAAQDVFSALLSTPDLEASIRARTLNSGALFWQHQGHYERARDYYLESYAIWQRLEQPFRQGTVLLNMGILHYELQAYAAAESSVLQSVTLFADAGADYYLALAHNELGLIARDQGHWDTALTYFEQAAATFARIEATDYLGRVVNNMGEIALLRGQLDVALARFERARTHMTTRVYLIDVAMNLGMVCQASGDNASAMAHYRQALELAQTLDRREVLALIYARIGHATWRQGQFDQAQASYAAAVDAVESTRAPLRDESLLINLMGRWQQVYEAAIQFCLAHNDAAQAFHYAEQARARAFADLLARRNPHTTHEQVIPVTMAETQAALSPGMLLLVYVTTGIRGPETALLDAMPSAASAVRDCLAMPPALILFALTHTTISMHLCTLDPNLLQATSPYLADGRRFCQSAILRRLYDALIAPVADHLADATHVIIAPHGPLHQIPFAALLDPTQQPLLAQVSRLTCVPGATVLLRTPPITPATPRQSCLAVGYDGDTEPRLRHTEAEATAIARLCQGTAWCSATDVISRLVHEARHYRWLHLACHGEFNLHDPLKSWLEPGPDQRLTAAEVIEHLVLHADLVILSACRSGVSQILRGDEPLGLVRAFLRAGTQAVLVTLWAVDDTATRLLMERLYQVLHAQPVPDPAAALCSAQRYLREVTASTVQEQLKRWEISQPDFPSDPTARPYADPEYWAAYVLIGGMLSVSNSS